MNPHNLEDVIQLARENVGFWKGMRCDHCDNDCDSAPCSCFELLEAVDRAETRLSRLLVEKYQSPNTGA